MCIAKMKSILLFMLIVKFSEGFLLDSSNTSLPVKQTYLTVAEYYGDKNQQHHEQEAYRTQFRDEQDKALKLLADQLQQRRLAMEQKINQKNEPNPQFESRAEQKYRELLQKYEKLQQNYTILDQTLRKQNQVCFPTNTKLQKEIDNLKENADSTANKTNNLQQEISELNHLKSVNQLQTLSTLSDKMNTFDSRITLLSGHEQSRNQDFLALYNLTTSTSSRLKQLEAEQQRSLSMLLQEYNTSISALQQEEKQTRFNLTKRLNDTNSKMELLNQSQSMSLTQLQQMVEQNNKKVVLMACNQGIDHFNSGSTYRFPSIVTQAGFPDLASFISTGKIMCPSNGIYHISLVVNSYQDLVIIDVMKNSVNKHRQYITGKTSGNWAPGTTITVLELSVNDTVWIKTNTDSYLANSCLTIYNI